MKNPNSGLLLVVISAPAAERVLHGRRLCGSAVPSELKEKIKVEVG